MTARCGFGEQAAAQVKFWFWQAEGDKIAYDPHDRELQRIAHAAHPYRRGIGSCDFLPGERQMKFNPLRSAIAVLFVSLGWLAQPAAASLEGSPGGTAQAKVVGDHVLMRAVLSTEKFHKETHLVLDYNDEQPLRIYNCILGYVQYGEGEETIKILADGMRIEVPKEDVEASSECTLFLKNLSGQYSVELQDVDVSAILGGPVLRQYALGMNLAEGEVSFTPAAEANVEDAMLWAESVITGLRTTEEGRVLAPLSIGEKDRSLMAFNTAGYHSYVNAALAGIPQEVTRRGKPVVVVISTSEYHQLLTEAQRARASFVDHLLAFPSGDFEQGKVEPRPVEF